MRRVLIACVASNIAFGIAGVAALPYPTTVVAAGPHARMHPVASPTTPPTISAIVNGVSAAAPSTEPSRSASTPSSHRSSSRTATTAPVSAADDVTGITSSAAPPTSVRVAPDAGSYPATFAGSASINGRAQSIPSAGSMVFAATGGLLRQSSPKTPGNIALTQRFADDRSDLVEFQLSAGDTTKVFRPSSPVTLLRYNAPAGSNWSWTASSTDEATHVNATVTVGGASTVNVAGVDVPTVEVRIHITISGDITGTAELTVQASPTHRLPVVQRQVIDAKAKSGLLTTTRFVSDVTTTLTALQPTR
jgi:hypothetical protein